MKLPTIDEMMEQAFVSSDEDAPQLVCSPCWCNQGAECENVMIALLNPMMALKRDGKLHLINTPFPGAAIGQIQKDEIPALIETLMKLMKGKVQ